MTVGLQQTAEKLPLTGCIEAAIDGWFTAGCREAAIDGWFTAGCREAAIDGWFTAGCIQAAIDGWFIAGCREAAIHSAQRPKESKKKLRKISIYAKHLFGDKIEEAYKGDVENMETNRSTLVGKVAVTLQSKSQQSSSSSSQRRKQSKKDARIRN